MATNANAKPPANRYVDNGENIAVEKAVAAVKASTRWKDLMNAGLQGTEVTGPSMGFQHLLSTADFY